MKLILVLTLLLLLSACGQMDGSAEAICSIPPAVLDEEGLSPANALQLDLFVERFVRACRGL